MNLYSVVNDTYNDKKCVGYQCQHPVQTHLRVTAGLVPDHCNKANIALKPVTQVFGFPVHTNVIFTLYSSLPSVQKVSQASKKPCRYLY